MTIKVNPEMLRNTAAAIQADIDHAQAIVNGYLANQENVLGSNTWSGDGSRASHGTASELQSQMSRALQGAHRLTEGLTQAAAIMESKDADDVTAYQGLCGASPV